MSLCKIYVLYIHVYDIRGSDTVARYAAWHLYTTHHSSQCAPVIRPFALCSGVCHMHGYGYVLYASCVLCEVRVGMKGFLVVC